MSSNEATMDVGVRTKAEKAAPARDVVAGGVQKAARVAVVVPEPVVRAPPEVHVDVLDLRYPPGTDARMQADIVYLQTLVAGARYARPSTDVDIVGYNREWAAHPDPDRLSVAEIMKMWDRYDLSKKQVTDALLAGYASAYRAFDTFTYTFVLLAHVWNAIKRIWLFRTPDELRALVRIPDDEYHSVVDVYYGSAAGLQAIASLEQILAILPADEGEITQRIRDLLESLVDADLGQPLPNSVDMAIWPEPRARVYAPPPRVWRLDAATGLPSRDNPQQLTPREWDEIMPDNELDDLLADQLMQMRIDREAAADDE